MILILFCFSLFLFFGFSEVAAADGADLPNDPDYKKLWYLRQIRADKVWDKAEGGREVVAAVIDAGIDIDHLGLKN